MRPKVVLDEEAGELWPSDFDLAAHKTSKKLVSVLDILGPGQSQISALSCHCSYLATAVHTDHSNLLFIISLAENRVYLLKRTVQPCTALSFHPSHEHSLFLATASRKVYSINVEEGSVVVMEGHHLPAWGVGAGARSPVVLTFNPREVLLWTWPSLTCSRRLEPQGNWLTIVWAGHVWQQDEVVVGFGSGHVMVWPRQQLDAETLVEPPEGVEMEFKAFALSRGGEWLVGGGGSRLLVTYSLVSRCVAQVVQLPAACTDVSQPLFLPPMHPKYPQALVVLSSSGIITVIDFTNAMKLKTLRSPRHAIDSVSVNEDGSFLVATFENSTTKVYPVRALFPATPEEEEVVESSAAGKEDVAFKIIERKEEKLKEEEEEERRRAAEAKDIRELLDKNKWHQILLEYGSFPDKYRKVIWASMLEVPRNYSVFSALLDKGTHTAFEGLSQTLQLSDGTLLKALQRTLSCLAHWAPFLARVEFLPDLIFPFVKMYHTNPLMCFEVTATVIMNWCRLWFEFWPEPGVTVLNVVEQLVCDADPALLSHLMQLKVSAKLYVWPLLTSAFSRVLSSNDWLVLWDNLVSSPPSLLPCVAAAFTLTSRRTLLTCSTTGEVKLYYSQETWVPVKRILGRAFDLHARKGKELSLLKVFGGFTPLPSGGLPLFNLGPHSLFAEEKEEIKRQQAHTLMTGSADPQRGSPTRPPPSTCGHQWDQRDKEDMEDMVYVVGRRELERQEEECLSKIRNLRRRHLATTTATSALQ